MLRCLPKLRSIFYLSFDGFWSFFFQFRHAQPFQSWYFLGGNKVFLGKHFSMFYQCWTAIWCQLGSILLHKTIQNPWKCWPQEAPNNASILASFLDPKNHPLETQLGNILALSFASRRPKRPSRTPLTRLPFLLTRLLIFLTHLWPMFDRLFDCFLVVVLSIFGWSVDRFWWVHKASI